MILCLTPNPAIDRTLFVRSIHLGDVHRAEKVLTAAGGKGLNVARAIFSLGDSPLCMGPLGGHAGNLLAGLAEQEGFSAKWTRVTSETRTCIILVQSNQDATVINETGQELTAEECKALTRDVVQEAERANLFCSSGSLPPGFSQEQFKAMLENLVSLGKPVWVDTSGDALQTALDVPGIRIKVNGAELGSALGLEIRTADQAMKAIEDLQNKRMVPEIALTLGKDGALLCSESGVWLAEPPAIKLVSSVGSGDAFLGGLLFALQKNADRAFALRTAAAAGAANALEFGGGKFSMANFNALFDQVKISTGR